MVHFFGRLSFLVDENAHAVHFFISALLQLLDRCGGSGSWGWLGLRGCMQLLPQQMVGADPSATLVHARCWTVAPALHTHLTSRFGSLYGELARFVLRLLGFKPKDKKAAAQEGPAGAQPQQPGMPSPAATPGNPAAKHRGLPGLPGAPVRPAVGAAAASGGGQWDSLWKKDA